MASFIPSPACIALIKEFEGVKNKVYRCPANIFTVGVGHTGPEVKAGEVWSDARVDAALIADLKRFSTAINAALGGTKTTQHQFDAMVCLAFNIGSGAFASSSVLANHKVGRYAIAAASFLLWNKATVAGKKVVLAGLDRRRKAEAELYAS